MNSLKFFAFIVLIAAAQAQTTADPSQFFAQVVRHQGTAPNIQRSLLCMGTMVTARHTITAASFIREFTREELRVYLQTTRMITSQDVREVEHIDIHPDFLPASPDAHNIAVMRLPYSDLDVIDVVPRNLGALTNVACTLFGFEGLGENITQSAVTITNTGCRANNLFCTTFTLVGAQCGGFIGAPVICANQAYVAGISNTEITCLPEGTGLTASATFLSIEPYADWIRDVSSAKTIVAQITIAMMTMGLVIGKILL